MLTPIKRPDMPTLVNFLYDTHKVEKLKVKLDEINGMIKEGPKYKNPNPHVVAHFDAINYLLQMADKPEFPCKDARLLTSHYKAEDHLYWFRKLHEKMTYPLSRPQHPEWADECATVRQHECGVYRNVPATLAFSFAPHHEDIPKILFVWLKDAMAINDAVMPVLDNPRGLTKAQHLQMAKFAHDSSLLCSNLLPFNYGNNRFGRLLENLLRLHWRLDWANVPADYDSYIRDIQTYNEQEIPNWQLRVKDMR